MTHARDDDYCQALDADFQRLIRFRNDLVARPELADDIPMIRAAVDGHIPPAYAGLLTPA